MTLETSTLVDAFDASALDEEVELSALARAIELAEGFSLLLVRCNQASQRERLMKTVCDRLLNLNFQAIHFREPVDHLLDALSERLSSPLPDAVFVCGLEHSLRTLADVDTAPLIANLNASRNSFSQVIPRPLVLWIPEYALTAIMQGAPDFFSIRSGTYFFAANPAEVERSAYRLAAGDEWEAESLSLSEKQDRITAIETLLADYESLPNDQRNYQAEILLRQRLGSLFLLQGNYDLAWKHFETALACAERVDNRAAIGILSLNLGNTLAERGKYELALQHYQRTLEIAGELGDRAIISQALHNIGLTHQFRGDYDAASQYYKRSLEIKEALSKNPGTADTLLNLGTILMHRGEHKAASEYYQRALSIFARFNNRSGIATTLNQLSNLHFLGGKYDEALQQSRRALEIRKEIGDQVGIAASYGQIGQLLMETRHYDEAFKYSLAALFAYAKLQSPHMELTINDLKRLRAKWGEIEFDAAWKQATGEAPPDGLKI